MSYGDDFCCDMIESVDDGELVDTREGYTFMYTYVCESCKRKFEVTNGAMTFGANVTEEVDYDG